MVDEKDFDELVQIVVTLCEAVRRNPYSCSVAVEQIAERARVLRQKRRITEIPPWSW